MAALEVSEWIWVKSGGLLIKQRQTMIQGVPGFSFVVQDRRTENKTRARRSLSLDLFDQWETMENHKGSGDLPLPRMWCVPFAQALEELRPKGGIEARSRRYHRNNRLLVGGCGSLAFLSTAVRHPPVPHHYGRFTARRIQTMNSKNSMTCSKKKALSSIRERSRT